MHTVDNNTKAPPLVSAETNKPLAWEELDPAAQLKMTRNILRGIAEADGEVLNAQLK